MTKRFIKNVGLGLLGSSAIVGSAWAAHYVVKEHDTLSQIAQKSISGPVYGKDGSLNQVLALNSELKNHADLIVTGQVIELPGDAVLAESNSSSHQGRRRADDDPSAEPERGVASSCPGTPVTTKDRNEATLVKRSPASDAESDDIDHHLLATLGYRFTTMSAQDPVNSSSAKLFTSSDLEFAASWSQDWNKSVSTFFEFGFEKLSFEPSNNPSKSLSNPSQSPAHFTLGVDTHANSRFVFRTSVTYGQELFTGAQGGGSISVDSVFVPAVSEEIIFSALQRGRTSVGLEGGGSFLFSAAAGSYSVNSGYAVNGGLFLNQNFGHENKDSLLLLVGFENRNQNTSLVNQSQGDAFARITFSLPIFGGGGDK